jgi:hypothetical protein
MPRQPTVEGGYLLRSSSTAPGVCSVNALLRLVHRCVLPPTRPREAIHAHLEFQWRGSGYVRGRHGGAPIDPRRLPLSECQAEGVLSDPKIQATVPLLLFLAAPRRQATGTACWPVECRRAFVLDRPSRPRPGRSRPGAWLSATADRYAAPCHVGTLRHGLPVLRR